MTTENDEWKSRNRFSDYGSSENGQKEKTYQSYNRKSYGSSSGNYKQTGNYDRQGGNYNRPKPNYDRSNNTNYGNQGGNNPNTWGNNYDRRGNSQRYSRPQEQSQRVYDGNRQQNLSDSSALAKKRRPRVGEVPAQERNTNFGPVQRGNYNRDNRSGQQQQRPYSKPFNKNNQGRGNAGYDQNLKYSNKKQLKYREEQFDPDEPIRLNKYLSNSGVCSRREADEFIKAGIVKVNGETVTELGIKVKRGDAVTFHNDAVKLENKVYVLLNKPKNCVTTAEDPQERLTVMDLVKNACQERIVPVGRLDRNTTGVLLLTNDGDLASKLTHPKFLKKKIYHVWLDKDVSITDMQKIAEGVELEDGEIHADAISYVSETDKTQVGIEIHSGQNRVVRRMLETLGYRVVKLDRVYFAGLTKKNLKRGQWRYLNEKEVSMLRMGAFD